MPRRERIRARYRTEIRRAAQRFRDHEGITTGKIVSWMMQFEDSDLTLAAKVLKNIRYYSGSSIRTMLRDLVHRVYQSLQDVQRQRVYFIPVGAVYAGASIVARALRDTPGVTRNQIKDMSQLERLSAEEVGAIVFLDDFSGTGNTLTDWWDTVEPVVRPKMAPVIVGLLVLNYMARLNITRFAQNIVLIDELTENDNVFAPSSTVLDDVEKQTVLDYCRKTRCQPEYEMGYGRCGLLLAFRHFCPNNSLPILWYSSPRWSNIFLRRAI